MKTDTFTTLPEEEEEKYDHPDNTVWIITVDDAGDAHVLRRPNIHWSFFEEGNWCDDIGIIGYEKFAPGLYKVTTSFTTTTDWESGTPDGHEFFITEHEVLYLLESVDV